MPLLRRLDPERAHELALRALRLGSPGARPTADDPALAVEVLGRRFANPIGLAAGFDKNAVAVAALMRLGFGFVETGTVTPRPQSGNPRPRLFRLDEDRAVINRMGFNNAGLEAYLRDSRAGRVAAVPLGANVGINKEGADPERDYPALIAAVAPLRRLRGDQRLVAEHARAARPAGRGAAARASCAPSPSACRSGRRSWSRSRPTLPTPAWRRWWRPASSEGVQGLIVVEHHHLAPGRPAVAAMRGEAGGLSGAPLFRLSTAVLARASLLARGPAGADRRRRRVHRRATR